MSSVTGKRANSYTSEDDSRTSELGSPTAGVFPVGYVARSPGRKFFHRDSPSPTAIVFSHSNVIRSEVSRNDATLGKVGNRNLEDRRHDMILAGLAEKDDATQRLEKKFNWVDDTTPWYQVANEVNREVHIKKDDVSSDASETEREQAAPASDMAFEQDETLALDPEENPAPHQKSFKFEKLRNNNQEMAIRPFQKEKVGRKVVLSNVAGESKSSSFWEQHNPAYTLTAVNTILTSFQEKIEKPTLYKLLKKQPLVALATRLIVGDDNAIRMVKTFPEVKSPQIEQFVEQAKIALGSNGIKKILRRHGENKEEIKIHSTVYCKEDIEAVLVLFDGVTAGEMRLSDIESTTLSQLAGAIIANRNDIRKKIVDLDYTDYEALRIFQLKAEEALRPAALKKIIGRCGKDQSDKKDDGSAHPNA